MKAEGKIVANAMDVCIAVLDAPPRWERIWERVLLTSAPDCSLVLGAAPADLRQRPLAKVGEWG